MSEYSLGDAPIEPEYIEKMRLLAAFLDEQFNGRAKGQERTIGFVLLMFPFGERAGRCNYISNGADRRDIAAMFREQAARFEGMPEQKGRA